MACAAALADRINLVRLAAGVIDESTTVQQDSALHTNRLELFTKGLSLDLGGATAPDIRAATYNRYIYANCFPENNCHM